MSDASAHPVAVEVPAGEVPAGPMPAHLWLPPSGTGPGLVLLQEIFGVSSYIQQRGADLAELGYVVLAPEIYWRLADHDIDEADEDVLTRALAVVGRLDWDLAVSDSVAALNHLRGRAETTGGVGLLGFCFGGGLAFNVAAVESPDCLVSYYGSAIPQLLGMADQITAPSLHHFGLADDYLPPETVAEITKALDRQPASQVETYPGAGHAFDNPSPTFFHRDASMAAWAVTTRFLAARLPFR